MAALLAKKFKDPVLAAQLLSTGDAQLIEGNTWGDKIWGCVQVNGAWVGENGLGKLLMQIRSTMAATDLADEIST
jgi:N-glycosidase YbiA